MTQDEMTVLEAGHQDHDELKDRIVTLFEQLPPDRQEALLDELQQIFDLCVEESEEEEDQMPY